MNYLKSVWRRKFTFSGLLSPICTLRQNRDVFSLSFAAFRAAVTRYTSGVAFTARRKNLQAQGVQSGIFECGWILVLLFFYRTIMRSSVKSAINQCVCPTRVSLNAERERGRDVSILRSRARGNL